MHVGALSQRWHLRKSRQQFPLRLRQQLPRQTMRGGILCVRVVQRTSIRGHATGTQRRFDKWTGLSHCHTLGRYACGGGDRCVRSGLHEAQA